MLRLLAALALQALIAAGCAGAPPAPHRPHPETWPPDGLGLGYIGHATVLLEIDGTFILTDPAFFDRVGPAIGSLTVGPTRVVAPALPLAALPPPAVVVITHAHYDSLDLPSLWALPKHATLVGPTGCSDLLGGLGFDRYVELAWGERTTVDGLTIEAIPVNHWGKRLPWGRDRGYNGYLFEKGGFRVVFASDTAYTPDFTRFRREGPPLDLILLGIGAYDPWVRHHANPEQAWRMFVESGAVWLAPVHWDTFRLGHEAIGEAIARLRAAAGPAVERIVIDEVGGEWRLPEDGAR